MRIDIITNSQFVELFAKTGKVLRLHKNIVVEYKTGQYCPYRPVRRTHGPFAGAVR